MATRRRIGRAHWASLLLAPALLLLAAEAAHSAYHHQGEIDSAHFLAVYPDAARTKLDSCTTCHTGGSYQEASGKTLRLGSCQWCHRVYGYDKTGDLGTTLNAYGLDYNTAGRSVAALQAIATRDSDDDGYSNAEEIAALRYPGDQADDPTKVPAPARVFTREQLLQLPQHSQFLLMNASKSDDFYAEYRGVTLERLLDGLLLESATSTTVYAPDGFAQSHPLAPELGPGLYHVFGDYPAASYHYDSTADMSVNPAGWCRYDAPSAQGRADGDPVANPDGLKLLLAITRDGEYLTPGALNLQNKLDGEGPFRVVPPQKHPGPPDQRSTAQTQSVIWPYDVNADHNAGFSTRATTIIKVEPLPAGTTDIDLLEAGWRYVDEGKIVVYGAIDPVATILEKLDGLTGTLAAASKREFRNPGWKAVLLAQLELVEWWVGREHYDRALQLLEGRVVHETDACYVRPARRSDDVISDCELQRQVQWTVNEVAVLLKIVQAESPAPAPPCHHAGLCRKHAQLQGPGEIARR
jgi:hypothetical protein